MMRAEIADRGRIGTLDRHATRFDHALESSTEPITRRHPPCNRIAWSIGPPIPRRIAAHDRLIARNLRGRVARNRAKAARSPSSCLSFARDRALSI
jgi:hypothetical protein